MKGLINRIYNDYIPHNRYGYLREILGNLKSLGYEFSPICDYTENPGEKRIYLRHDIDTDPKIALKMAQVEHNLGIRGTYYFRWFTFNKKIIDEIRKLDMEIGYHYEEVTTYANKHGLNRKELVQCHMDEIRETFLENLKRFELKTGHKVVTVSSHGNFEHKRIKTRNIELMTDEVLHRGGVLLEAYSIEEGCFRVADRMYPQNWYPQDPVSASGNGDNNTGLILLHPRQWAAAPFRRLQYDMGRVLSEFMWNLRILFCCPRY